jgi:hypothetical protein
LALTFLNRGQFYDFCEYVYCSTVKIKNHIGIIKLPILGQIIGEMEKFAKNFDPDNLFDSCS